MLFGGCGITCQRARHFLMVRFGVKFENLLYEDRSGLRLGAEKRTEKCASLAVARLIAAAPKAAIPYSA